MFCSMVALLGTFASVVSDLVAVDVDAEVTDAVSLDGRIVEGLWAGDEGPLLPSWSLSISMSLSEDALEREVLVELDDELPSITNRPSTLCVRTRLK
jgi:hypothetical protein